MLGQSCATLSADSVAATESHLACDVLDREGKDETGGHTSPREPEFGVAQSACGIEAEHAVDNQHQTDEG